MFQSVLLQGEPGICVRLISLLHFVIVSDALLFLKFNVLFKKFRILLFLIITIFVYLTFVIKRTLNLFVTTLTLKLPGPYVGMGGSLTVTVA